MIFLRNLLRSKLRSSLTILGIGMGIALFVSVASISDDMIGQVSRMMGAYNTEIMVLSRGAFTPLHSRLAQEEVDELNKSLGFDVSPIIIGRLREQALRGTTVVGIHQNMTNMFPVIKGRSLDEKPHQLMVGVLASDRLNIHPGDTLSINGTNYAVSGVFRTGSITLDSSLATGLEHAHSILGRGANDPPYNFALVLAGSASEAEVVVAKIRTSFPQFRSLSSLEFAGIQQTFRAVEIFAWSIVGIALIGAILVLANTLFMSIMARSQEIGIMLAIGWRPWYILRLFWLESMLLCALGIMVGNLVAYLLLYAISHQGAVAANITMPTTLSPIMVAGSVALAPVLSALAMIYPAFAVYRMRPIEVLRYE